MRKKTTEKHKSVGHRLGVNSDDAGVAVLRLAHPNNGGISV
jgi:hypothetical protein